MDFPIEKMVDLSSSQTVNVDQAGYPQIPITATHAWPRHRLRKMFYHTAIRINVQLTYVDIIFEIFIMTSLVDIDIGYIPGYDVTYFFSKAREYWSNGFVWKYSESTDLPVVHNLIFRHTHIIAWHNLHNLDSCNLL